MTAGPSPRAWGLQGGGGGAHRRGRSIPTCVGFTVNDNIARICKDGPSPRAWGLPLCQSCRRNSVRSIPTCVGFTPLSLWKHRRYTVHPHVRGVYVARRKPPRCRCGPSPRAWGLRKVKWSICSAGRSIPTCVGFTAIVGGHCEKCGGPSPRAWGLPPPQCPSAPE